MNTKINSHVKAFALTWLLCPLFFSAIFMAAIPDVDIWDWMFPVLFFSALAGIYMTVIPFQAKTSVISRESVRLSMFNAAVAAVFFLMGMGFSSSWERTERAPELLAILGDCVVLNENQALCHNNHWVCNRLSGECRGVGE